MGKAEAFDRWGIGKAEKSKDPWGGSLPDSWRRAWKGRLPLRVYVTEFAPESEATVVEVLVKANAPSPMAKPGRSGFTWGYITQNPGYLPLNFLKM